SATVRSTSSTMQSLDHELSMVREIRAAILLRGSCWGPSAATRSAAARCCRRDLVARVVLGPECRNKIGCCPALRSRSCCASRAGARVPQQDRRRKRGGGGTRGTDG